MTNWLKNSTVKYNSSKPFTEKEVIMHKDKDRILATIYSIKLEAQESCNRARELGYREGKISE